jgi:uncharacterized protein YbjQ (UPF0145 family)
MGIKKMLILTSTTIEGKVISEYHGLVTGDAILGNNKIEDFCCWA